MSALAVCPAESGPMQVDCAWCKKTMSPGCQPVSHGICPDCSAEYLKELDAIAPEPATPQAE